MATRTSPICIFDDEKRHFCTLCTCIIHFLHFADVLVLSTTQNELFCSCVDDVSIWWQMFNFVLLSQKRWFRFNARMVRTHFASVLWLWITAKLLQKREVTFSNDVLAVSTSSLLKLPNTKLNIFYHMLMSSTQLQNRSFHVMERTRTSIRNVQKWKMHLQSVQNYCSLLPYMQMYMQICDALVAVVIIVA